MGTFDVSLPADQPITFAPRCVVCEKPNPDEKISLSIVGADAEHFASVNTLNKIDGIPVCKACAPALQHYNFLYKLAQYTLVLPPIALFVFNKTPLWLNILLLIAAVVAAPLYSVISPPAFGATFLNDKATFEFKSKLVADEFAQLNNAAPEEAAPTE